MRIRALKYAMAYTLPLSVAFSFLREGWVTFIPVILSFVIIPGLELLISANHKNISEVEAELRKEDRMYDILLWLIVPMQYVFLVWYLFNIQSVEFLSVTWFGRTVGMGLLCGVMGINVAHELGHRRSKAEQLMAKMLLMTSMYPHFFIEHNYGHHKNVATTEDPASARYNEPLYTFWLRSIFYSYREAWQIENQRLKRKKKLFLSLSNEMLLYTLAEIVFIILIWTLFDFQVLVGFLLAAAIGILLLETVNYIEHYGLARKKLSELRYENTTPVHSWNSDHVLGRLYLFELSRHSDHHAYPHKKYQLLESYEYSPQMPTGYPGMMLLSLIPPLWFGIMNPRIKKGEKQWV